MADLFHQSIDAIRQFVEALLPGAAGLKGAQWLFRHRDGDIPICQTRVTYGGRGVPLLNKRVAVHPLASGIVEIRVLEPDAPSSKSASPKSKKKR